MIRRLWIGAMELVAHHAVSWYDTLWFRSGILHTESHQGGCHA
jgi:hypothetical protein